LPDNVGGYLYLNSLTSAEGLQLPDNVGGYLYLDSLTDAEVDKIEEERPDLKIGE
jgi:ubiquinone biosynthesis protein Coq4